MALTDLARWHWGLIGAAVGVVAAYSYSSSEADNLPPQSVAEFFGRAGDKSQQQATQGQPILRNVLVYPPVEGAYNKLVQVVKFDRLGVNRDTGTPAVAREMVLIELPLDRGGRTFNSVEEFLAQANQEFTTPWYRAPAYAYPLGALGGVLLIGVFWPALLSLLTGGSGDVVREKNAKRDRGLMSYMPQPTEDHTPTGKPMPTAQQMAELDALNADLEARIGSGLAVTANGPTLAGVPSDQSAQVKQLSGDADKPVPVAAPVEDDRPKKFSGEWYPVAKQIKKD